MDNVRLTAHEIVITVQFGPTYLAERRIPLEDVRSVRAREAIPRDGPWLITNDKHRCHVPPGEVVVIKHEKGTQILPLYDAAAFADIIDVRVKMVQEAVRRLPRGEPQS
jgi:hypothetical protein